jgi:hypothetical protein
VIRSAAALSLLLCSATAAAQTADGDSDEERKERLADDKNWFNLRAGLSSADANDRPVLCLEVAVHWGLSVEGCGTGAGILHSDGGELAHFRAKYSLIERKTIAGKLRGQVGAGFAELQLGDDEPGFNFGDPATGSDSAAGPEAALSLQLLTHIGRGFELVTSASAGVAAIPGADQLSVPQSQTQAFASLEIGIGW